MIWSLRQLEEVVFLFIKTQKLSMPEIAKMVQPQLLKLLHQVLRLRKLYIPLFDKINRIERRFINKKSFLCRKRI